jgi:transposase-like protein
MARRSDIDWEPIEKDYRAGSLSVAAVARKHGVSAKHLRDKAKQYNWQRDLTAAIQARARAKISTIDVEALIEQRAGDSYDKSTLLIKEAVEQASDIIAGVIVRHRTYIRQQIERGQRLEELFDHHMRSTENLGDTLKAAQSYKLIVDARAKIIAMEREAFNIKSEDGDERDDVHIKVSFVDADEVDE